MLDKIDRDLLINIQKNGKKTIKELAAELHLTTSPVFERIKRLEKEGIIEGYTAIIDNKKVGKGQVVFCNLSMPDYTPEKIFSFEQNVNEMPQVLECYHMAGEIDYQMKILVGDLEEYYNFLTEFAKLTMVKVHSSVVVLKQVKNSTVIAL